MNFELWYDGVKLDQKVTATHVTEAHRLIRNLFKKGVHGYPMPRQFTPQLGKKWNAAFFIGKVR